MLKRIFAILICLSVLLSMAACGEEKGDNNNSQNGAGVNNGVDEGEIAEKFEGDFGLEVGFEIVDQSFSDSDRLEIQIKNDGEKTVEAVEIYITEYNVYGELYTGSFYHPRSERITKTIESDGKSSVDLGIISTSTKTLKIYIYSIYYEDGTFWGDKDATADIITKYGKEYEVKVNK